MILSMVHYPRSASLTRKRVISEDLSGEFFIPSYQRGYRWSAAEVLKLLDDLNSEVVTAPNPRSYYLQPIVVMQREAENVWELIDGQQRLTTLYLIVKYLRDSSWLPRANVYYSLTYETRENSREYLETLDPALRHTNIDFHYMYEAYRAVKDWFEQQPDPEAAANGFYRALARHVYLIWYEAAEGTDRNELFRRLNVGRIPLTDAELIKALVLSRAGSGGQSGRQKQIAVQWDAFERELRNPELWAFITGSDSVWSTHIDLIFRALAGSIDGREQERYWVFEVLRPRIETSADEFWRDVVGMHGLITGWFHDRTLYHLIGFLISTGGRNELERIVDLARGRTKTSFRRSLVERIRTRLGQTRAGLDDVNYEDDRKECANLLLLMNISAVLGTLSDEARAPEDGARFSFYAHAKGRWSVEHIHAQNAAPLTRAEQWKTWLELHQQALAALPGDSPRHSTELGARIQEVLQLIDGPRRDGIEAKFRALEEEILAVFTSDGDAGIGDDVHLLPNLALLEQGHNSALGNSVFEVKRQEILRLDRSNAYIPPCTRNVFLKYYTDDADQQLHVWGPQDRDAYYAALCDALSPYLMSEPEELPS